ncbi:MAG: glycerophosphodiester phosphodiesterase [Planctomycetales bacterium]|nr:glycerophosphodiester phosphodiesterase [Planctomycetales bacterium]
MNKIVIAHRGASGYLPEHTLAAKALALGLGANYLEQDVVLTQDDVPIVLHDIFLDTVTDVATKFPQRARDDGRFYAIDFTLSEIRDLAVHERFHRDTGIPVFAARFPHGGLTFRIPTLAEELEFVAGLRRSTKRSVGIYPEIKAPAFHRQHGKDISRLVLATLSAFGFSGRDAGVFLQCFDDQECRRCREELATQLPLIQLIGENAWHEAATDFDHLRTPAGLENVAQYADGIGPPIERIVTGRDDDGQPVVSDLTEVAHELGLVVHPYTFRIDALPEFSPHPEWLLSALFKTAGVDGLFADFPDVVVRFLSQSGVY